MNWRRWYWLGFLLFAVVVSIIFASLPGGRAHCRYRPNARSCSDEALSAGIGAFAVVAAVVLLAGWLWWKWQQRKRR